MVLEGILLYLLATSADEIPSSPPYWYLTHRVSHSPEYASGWDKGAVWMTRISGTAFLKPADC